VIVQDDRSHKVDLDFVPDGMSVEMGGTAQPWIQLTIFHSKTGTEWSIKVMKMRPDVAIIVAKKILEVLEVK
jgi:hypothetical protein